MNYALGHSLSANNLMINLPIDKLEMTEDIAKTVNGDNHKKRAAASIWLKSVYLILLDLVNNSTTVNLPFCNKNAELYVKSISGDEFIKARKNKKWKDVDYLESNFTGAQPMFKFQKAGYTIEKPLYVDKKLKNIITDRLNSGKSYY